MTHDTPKAHKATTKAYQVAESLRPVVEQARAMGITSHDRLADYLTEQGVPTATGHGVWGIDAARKLKARLKELDACAADAGLAGGGMTAATRANAAALGGQVLSERSDEFARAIEPLLMEALSRGVRTNAGIADYLTMQGVCTATGNSTWNERQVKNLRQRLERLGAGP